MNNQNNFKSHIRNLVSYKNYVLLSLLIISFTLPSCMIEDLATKPHIDNTKVRGSGDLISEQLDLPYFNSISMNTAGLVEIESGSDQEVQVSVDDNIWEHIIIRVQDEELIIEVEQGISLSDFDLTVEVRMTDLKALTTNSAGSIRGLNTFEEDQIRLMINSAGSISLDLIANQLNTLINSAGSLLLSGEVAYHNSMLSSAGSLSAFGLQTETTVIMLNSAGNAHVSVSELLDVTINSVGSVYYKGNPEIKQKINSIGSVISAN